MHSPNEENGGRNEKLLAARKKLKQFQNARRQPSNSRTSDQQAIDGQQLIDSTSTSSKPPIDRRGRSRSSRSSRRGDGENDQENLDDFDDNDQQDDGGIDRGEDDDTSDRRPLSECYAGYSMESLGAHSTASTTKLSKHQHHQQQASNSSTTNKKYRRSSVTSTKSNPAMNRPALGGRYLETPEPIRISIAPEQQQEILLRREMSNASSTAAPFFHDEQRSPFQRVKRESESSETTPTNMPPPQQLQTVSLTNELNNPSTDPNPYQHLQHHQNFDPVSPDNALAPFAIDASSNFGANVQTQNDIRMENEEYFTPSTGHPIDHQNYQNPPPFVQETPTRSAADYFRSDPNLESINSKLKQDVDSVNAQLQQVNDQYAQLYAAYSKLFQQQQHQQQPIPVDSDEKLREIDELRKQIQLHLHTMSVLVDEKTDLQSQLRQAMEIANQKHFENEELQGRLKANRERLTKLETDAESSSGNSRTLEDTLRRQMVELEKLRKESAQWQARASEAQQDRSEMNVKLKVRSREVDDLSSKLKDAEKQLHMKDIYIQQITGGPGVQRQQETLANELEQQKHANVELYAQLDAAAKALEQFRWESEQNRQGYESYAQQLNAERAGLFEKLDALEKETHQLRSKCGDLEHELEKSTAANRRDGGGEQSEGDTSKSGPNAEDLDSLKLVLNEFEQGLQAANEKSTNLEKLLQEKSLSLQNTSEQLNERDRLIRQLNEQLNEKYQHDDSAKSLLEQLHNEKATVSRAVAQNIELKKQLVELQEKFVAMTESGLEAATKLESTERQLETLKEKLDHKDDDTKAAFEKRDEEIATLRRQLESSASQNIGLAHFEDKLRHYEIVQKNYDDELRLRHQEISHLKVEKADLSQRLNVLMESNQNLQATTAALTANHSGNTDGRQKDEEIQKLQQALTESKTEVQSLSEEIEHLKTHGEEADEIRRQLASNEQELAETRRQLHHITTENGELHRIMEQNAEDENQNTIHIELRHALNRSTSLSNENERLRQRIQELESQFADVTREKSTASETTEEEKTRTNSANVGMVDETDRTVALSDSNSRSQIQQCTHQHHHENGDDRSSVCSEHIEQRREAGNTETFDSMKSAMDQLQQRFTKAMTENADLSDQNQQLEHLITQLQSETETIGEYITIYQHQRRTIRERLREKEEYVARLSREKEDVQVKLSELQELVVHLLRERGSLKQYAQMKPVYGRPPTAVPSTQPRKPRGLSETLVDEVSGAETNVASSGNDEESSAIDVSPVARFGSPSGVEAPLDPVQQLNGDVLPAISDQTATRPGESESPVNPGQSSPSSVDHHHHHSMANDSALPYDVASPSSGSSVDDDSTAERILRLLTEIRRPDLVNSLPPVDRSLHCKYCTGRLIML